MTRRRADPHARFDAWLLAGADGEPARDLALHASVCSICIPRVAALDLLTAVDTGRAPIPVILGPIAWPATALPGVLRYAAAFATVTAAAALIGLAGSRLIDLRSLTNGGAGESPVQGVLGGTGGPSPTPETQPTEPVMSSAAATASAGATPTAAATPASSIHTPAATPRPATPRPSASASAVGSIAPSATPTAVESATSSPTPSATQTPTPVPTDTPTPEPTPTPTI